MPNYPFSAIVGQDEMKLALLIAATDQSIGGVMIFGDRGTGKSTAVRALAALLPPLIAVKDCQFHCAPGAGNFMQTNCGGRRCSATANAGDGHESRKRDGADCQPDRTFPRTALSDFQRKGKSDAEDHAGGNEGFGSSIDYKDRCCDLKPKTSSLGAIGVIPGLKGETWGTWHEDSLEFGAEKAQENNSCTQA